MSALVDSGRLHFGDKKRANADARPSGLLEALRESVPLLLTLTLTERPSSYMSTDFRSHCRNLMSKGERCGGQLSLCRKGQPGCNDKVVDRFRSRGGWLDW